jgi:hypothetical protein
VNRKELSEVVTECAARTERAAAWQRETVAQAEAERAKAEAERAKYEKIAEAARARQERARAKQEEAVARQEAAVQRQEKGLEEFRASRKRTEDFFHDFMRRTDKMIAEDRQWAKKVFAELDDQRDERRALIEALFQAIDRLPPPPPHLRSA